MPRQRFKTLPEAKRRAILQAAAEAFAEHGYEAASQNQIIARAGISKGAFYYYFDDKADLYTTILAEALQRLLAKVVPMGEAADRESFWQQCRLMYRTSLQFWKDEPTMAALVRRLAEGDGPSNKQLMELGKLTHGYFGRLIEQGRALGVLRDDLPSSLLVRILDGVTTGIDAWVTERASELDDDEMDELATTIVEMFRRMAGVEEGRA